MSKRLVTFRLDGDSLSELNKIARMCEMYKSDIIRMLLRILFHIIDNLNDPCLLKLINELNDNEIRIKLNKTIECMKALTR